MKEVFSYTGSYTKFYIYSHKGLFYLKHSKDSVTIAKSDDQNVLRAYIDGYERGHIAGRDTIQYNSVI